MLISDPHNLNRTEMANPRPDQPSRLLALPPELRHWVYMSLEPYTRLYTMLDVEAPETDVRPTIALVTMSLPTGILGTGKLINSEAARILGPRLPYMRDHLQNVDPLHFVVDSYSFNTMFQGPFSLATAIDKQRKAIQTTGTASWRPMELAVQNPWEEHVDHDIGSEMYDAFFKFIDHCANYSLTKQSGKLLVTVYSHLSDEAHDVFNPYALLNLNFWGQKFGINSIELQTYKLNDKRVASIQRKFNITTALAHPVTSQGMTSVPWTISTRVIDESEWNAIDGAEKVYEVNGGPL
jgi:hypothetical protein